MPDGKGFGVWFGVTGPGTGDWDQIPDGRGFGAWFGVAGPGSGDWDQMPDGRDVGDVDARVADMIGSWIGVGDIEPGILNMR